MSARLYVAGDPLIAGRRGSLMTVVELGQALWHHAADLVALAPTPDPADPPPTTVNTNGVLSFFAEKIAPILLAVLGVVFIGRAQKGEVSKVLTSSAIAIIGVAFIVGGATLFFFGETLIKLVFTTANQ
jgi:hypothetical protein